MQCHVNLYVCIYIYVYRYMSVFPASTAQGSFERLHCVQEQSSVQRHVAAFSSHGEQPSLLQRGSAALVTRQLRIQKVDPPEVSTIYTQNWGSTF